MEVEIGPAQDKLRNAPRTYRKFSTSMMSDPPNSHSE